MKTVRKVFVGGRRNRAGKDRPKPTPSSNPGSFRSVGERQILGGGLAVASGGQVIGDFLAFRERAQAGLLDGRNMNEGVLGAVFRFDEAIAFVGVEEFNGTCGRDVVL